MLQFKLCFLQSQSHNEFPFTEKKIIQIVMTAAFTVYVHAEKQQTKSKYTEISEAK